MSRLPRRPVVVAAPDAALLALSRAVTLALRHEPDAFGLVLDAQGWVAVDDLLAALRAHDPQFAAVDRARLEALVAFPDRPRHEIVGDRMRSLYGHSHAHPLVLPPADPPELLYHGTSASIAERILAEGLVPKGRQYVHLTSDKAWARAIAYRKSTTPGLLQVRAQAARAAGVVFHNNDSHVWLSAAIAPEFIEAINAR
jgi:putative RNA 2'-phosphotransferase